MYIRLQILVYVKCIAYLKLKKYDINIIRTYKKINRTKIYQKNFFFTKSTNYHMYDNFYLYKIHLSHRMSHRIDHNVCKSKRRQKKRNEKT